MHKIVDGYGAARMDRGYLISIHLVSFYLLIMLLKFTVTTRLKDLIKMCALF